MKGQVGRVGPRTWRRALALRAVARCSLLVALAATAVLDAAPGRSFVWRATGRGGGAVYLVGSVHVLSKDVYPLNATLESAYKASNVLVEEIDLGAGGIDSQMQMLSRGMLPSSTTLQKVLTPATYALLTKHVTAAGLPIEPMQLLKPWMVALMLEAMEWQKAGLDPEMGLDKHFYDRAMTDNKKVQGLETIDYQLSRFDEMPMADQDHLLEQTLKDVDTEQAEMGKLVAAWKSGDVPTVERIVLTSLKAEPKLYERLLVERNRNWMPKLEALFASNTKALVVVGAAHLVGPDGLVAMLKAKGYTVEQM
jgi:uncharacterized protein YbaP (TraB family)